MKGSRGAEGARSEIIAVDQERVQSHVSEIVRGTVEETLNALLDAEAD